MYLTVLAFLAGIMALPFFSSLPPLWYFLPPLLLTLFLQSFCTPPYTLIFKYLFIALLGCAFVIWRSEHLLEWQLPETLESKNIKVTGIIASLPKITDFGVQFVLRMESIESLPIGFQEAGKVPEQTSRGAYGRYVSSETSRQHSQNLTNSSGTNLGAPAPEEGWTGKSIIKGDGYQPLAHPVSIDLSWYHYPEKPELSNSNSLLGEGIKSPLKVGDRWQFDVRLKRPHGLLNPGGFDYEKWLFIRGIRATGYVIHPENAKRLSSQSWRYPIDRMRQTLEAKVHDSLKGQLTAGLITALILGAQDGITQNQWRVMRATGTNHLMAIAGVHIAFVSGFIYAFILFFWRRAPPLTLRFPAPQAAACGALIAALIYSALAGFALPTQRALIMLSVFLLGVFLRRDLQVWNALALALGIILLWDPLATLSISFWLSFGAVFAIIYGITGRLKANGIWWHYGRVQWVITIGLIPICLSLFQQTSLVSLIANAIAVPAVGILVLPLCLTGAICVLILPTVAHWILGLAAKLIGWIWVVLGMLGQFPGAVWHQTMPNTWVLVAALVGVLLLIAPKGFPARWVGILWFFPLIFFKPSVPEIGTIRFTLLDVGQGLSAVVQTQHHALIFDTGPKMGEDDAGGRVIIPFLRAMGIAQIDILMISHGDSDHIGGAFSVLEEVPTKQILTSVPDRFMPKYSANLCLQGQHWEWDGVMFTVLYPTPGLLGQDNNSSCVLRIETAKGSLLLTGDIEKQAEAYLVHSSIQSSLPSTVLVAPHHGSKTSSTHAFVESVRPSYVLFPVGYKNRYYFPASSVTKRYQEAAQFETDKTGAVRMVIGGKQGVVVETERLLEKRVW